MTFPSLPTLVVFSVTLTACGTPPGPSPSSKSAQPAQLELRLASGAYNCEHKARVQIEREVRNRVTYRIHIVWGGDKYQLERDPSFSGLPRFEDKSSGLVWIDLPWKGLLLDGRTSKPLANECRPA